MGTHNSAGARVAQAMGISRVILERQTPFEELREIRRNTSVEFEVFIHGALCCSLSGLCLFSSWMGGASGNRGKCKQPCRRRYFTEAGNGFFFSTKDLYSLEHIPELKRTGINGLKIEGRMRRADYVSRVVSAYRLMLDAPEEDAAETLKEAKAVLAGALGRKWSPPFRTTADLQHAIQHRAVGASGLLCGEVQRADPAGFLADVCRPLQVGDTIRVQPRSGDEGPAFAITRMSIKGTRAHRARRGDLCRIHCDKPVEVGSLIFKTGVDTGSLDRRVSRIPPARPALDLAIEVDCDGIRVRPLGAESGWRSATPIPRARSRPLSADTVADQFRKTRSETFSAGRIDARVESGLFLRAADLKRERRAFWAWADATLGPEHVRDLWAARLSELKARLSAPLPPTAFRPRKTVRVRAGAANPVQDSLTARPVGEVGPDTDEVILPMFCPEPRLPALAQQVENLIARGMRRFRVPSLFGLDLLGTTPGLTVTLSFVTPVCNSLALEEAQELGAKRATSWVELERASAEDLAQRCGATVEFLVYGRLPILITRMALPVSGEITDARGARFTVEREGELTCVYPEKVYAVPAPEGSSSYVDLSHAEPGETRTDAFNYARELA
jgi:putative protease